MSHPAVQREVDWKASQLVFLAKWAYFTPMASKVLSSAVKEAFHRALDSPCKKLEDLSAVLFKAFVEVNKSLPDGDMAQEVKEELALVVLFMRSSLELFFSFCVG